MAVYIFIFLGLSLEGMGKDKSDTYRINISKRTISKMCSSEYDILRQLFILGWFYKLMPSLLNSREDNMFSVVLEGTINSTHLLGQSSCVFQKNSIFARTIAVTQSLPLATKLDTTYCPLLQAKTQVKCGIYYRGFLVGNAL